jgi:nucleotide-binding universal stress UspA family protein
MNILCPYDFTTRSNKAIEYASSFIHNFGGELHILHVLTPQLIMSEVPAYVIKDEVNTKALEALKRVKEETKKNLSIPSDKIIAHLEMVSVVQSINKITKSEAIDIVCMMTHNKTGFFYSFLGSVAENVVEQCPLPVILIHDDDSERKTPQRILYLISQTSSYLNQFEQFLDINKKWKSHVDVLHFEESKKDHTLEMMANCKKLIDAFEMNKYYDFQSAKSDDVHVSIEEQLRLEKYDMVVLAPEKKDFLQSILFQSVTKHMMHRIKLPMLVIKHNQDNITAL